MASSAARAATAGARASITSRPYEPGGPGGRKRGDAPPAPAARMRELVLAIRAIWSTWQDRAPLRFEGTHYTHTLMTPMFDPGPLDVGRPRIWLGGVGPRMTEVAGELADGFLVHPFCTE